MNTEIRQLLIQRAKVNNPITYGEIMSQMNLDQYGLSYELEEISRYEHENSRPMLTVMATYKKGGYGGEFFKLAEEFGNGSVDKLKKSDFTKVMRKRCHEYWKNEKSVSTKAITAPAFFNQEELT